jgi:hypothetical protein
MSKIEDTYFQVVILTLSNGKTISCYTKPFCAEDDKFTIVGVKITDLMPMPEGYCWSTLTENKT